MKIAAAAEILGLSPQTLRNLEGDGTIPPHCVHRSATGLREYRPEDVEEIRRRLPARLKSRGLTLVGGPDGVA